METRRIGSLEVSVAGVGTNNFGRRVDAAGSRAVVDAALDAGVNFFDSADIYGGGHSEEFLGAALQAKRDDAVIATKFGMGPPPDGRPGADPTWVAEAAAASLRRLGTDHIDLYWLHAPDGKTPIGDTLEALERLIAAGSVREIGCSNFSVDQLDEAADAAASLGVRPFVSVQNDYSLLQRAPEQGVLDACRRHGMSFVPYFPLASGLLTGKYRRGEPPPAGTRLAGMPPERLERALSDQRFGVVEALDGFAREHGHTLPELALSWLATNPLVASVIAGATSPEQVRANAAATTAWTLSGAELADLDARVGAG